MVNFERLCPGCMKDNAGGKVCGICGYDSDKGNAPDKLPVKFVIRDRYFVGKTVFSNSESTIYLGFDSIENKPVNIKEYFPAGIALRNPDKTVSSSRETQFAFNEGLLRFTAVNKKLIGLSLPSLPATYSVFEENSTAYAICDAVQGITLKSFLSRNGGLLKWEQVRPLILPLIDTVKALHDMSLVHGDISPDTVMVCKDGKLRLFGVPVRRTQSVKGGDASAAPSVHDGYAAAEQYGVLHEEVGEYTDVYGVCATLFTMITGIVPPPANERLKGDSLKIPAHFADELPRQVLVSLANGMQVKPANRTTDIESLKNELIYGETRENIRKTKRATDVKPTAEKDAESPEEKKKGSGLKYAAIASGITAAVFLILAIVLVFTVFKDQVFKKAEENINNDASMPSQQQIGDYDSDAVESKALYSVPDLRGKFFVEIEKMKELDHFKVVIKNKEYSGSYERGKICAQSVEAGSSKEHGTVIELTISLGASQVRMPGIVGLTQEQAEIELLKIGLLYQNIEVTEQYDTSALSGMVIGQYPERGKAISPESSVRVYVCKNDGEDENTDEEETFN